VTRLTFFTMIFVVASFAAVAKGSDDQQRSPRKVVEDFWNMEIDGGRLTPQGWNRAEQFFVRPTPMPMKKVISVVYKGSVISDPIVHGTRAEVTVDIQPQGRINSELLFIPSESYKSGLLVRLTLTDKHREQDSHSRLGKETIGAPEWRIEGAGNMLWISVDTAIRYVTEMRAKTSNPLIKKNADRTLAKLKSLH